MDSLYVVDINRLSDTLFANTFSHSIGCLFILLMVSFAVQCTSFLNLQSLPKGPGTGLGALQLPLECLLIDAEAEKASTAPVLLPGELP